MCIKEIDSEFPKACIVLGVLFVVAGFVMIFAGSQIGKSATIITLLGIALVFIGALVLVGVMGLIMPPGSGMDKPSIDDFGGV